MSWYEVTGTLADWVMAGAAAYAAFNAKQWFSQRFHTKGFDKAWVGVMFRVYLIVAVMVKY